MTPAASRPSALTIGSGREWRPARGASDRAARETARAAPRAVRSRRAPPARAPRHARPDTPRAVAAAHDCAAPPAAAGGSPRSRHAWIPSILARARSAQDDRSACPAGKAPGIRRWWSVAGVERGRHSDGQPFAALRATTLQYLASALRFHALTKPVRLGPAACVGLKRPLHRATLPSDRRTDTV